MNGPVPVAKKKLNYFVCFFEIFVNHLSSMLYCMIYCLRFILVALNDTEIQIIFSDHIAFACHCQFLWRN